MDRRQFTIWLESLAPEEQIGIAGGFSGHPVARYLNERDGGFWSLKADEIVLFIDRRDSQYCIRRQEGWLAEFCRLLKRPDAYRTVTAADCLFVLEQVP